MGQTEDLRGIPHGKVRISYESPSRCCLCDSRASRSVIGIGSRSVGLLERFENWRRELGSELDTAGEVVELNVEMHCEGIERLALHLGEGAAPGVHRELLEVGHPLARARIELEGCYKGRRRHRPSHPFPRHGSTSRSILRSVPVGMSPPWTAMVVKQSPHRIVTCDPDWRSSTQPRRANSRRRSRTVTTLRSSIPRRFVSSSLRQSGCRIVRAIPPEVRCGAEEDGSTPVLRASADSALLGDHRDVEGPPSFGAWCPTNRDTIHRMARAISVRLDDEADKALRTLEATGLTQSEAIRTALLGEVRHRRRSQELAAEAAALEADDADREEMLAVAELMEALRAPR